MVKLAYIKENKTMTNNTLPSLYRIPNLLTRSAIDDIWDGFFTNPMPVIQKATAGYPVTDIYVDEDGNSTIELALAGFTKEQLAVEVKDRSIIVKADAGESDGAATRRIARRSFTKTFCDYNNKLDFERTTAKFENGLLVVKVPPILEAQPLRVDIQ